MQANSQPITQPSPQWPPQHAEHGQRAPQQAYGQQPFHFPQPIGEADGAHGYAQHAPVQPLPFPPQASGQPPFNRYPQPAPDPDPNYGYAQQGQHGSAAPLGWGQQADPRGFDLGNYMSAPGQQGYAPQSDTAHLQPPPDQFGAPQGYGETDAEFDEAMADEGEEPRRGRRGLMIVAALVGAIGLGGGMAYAYKVFFPSRTGPVAVIKDTQGPVKSKPEVADGRGFPHTDKKLLNRLGDEGGPPPTSAAAAQEERVIDDPNAPRKVRLIPISPGGAPESAPPAAPPGLIVVPGVTLQNMGPPPARAQLPPPAPPPSAARVQLPPPGPPVKVVSQPPVRVASAANVPPPAAAEPAPPVKKAVVAKAAVPKAKEASAPAATSATGAGYVAVLASRTSRMEALKTFADLQQKYGEALASKTPDVQEANLGGDKGVRYRAVVGPPGSKDAASSVCKQLKAAGYNDCWVTAY